MNRTEMRRQTHFEALDGYRAIAVLLVFCGHYGGGLHQGPILQGIYYLTSFGPAGVGLFFVLSGFLITGILYDTRFDSSFFKVFYARRALRIFPVAYLVMFGCLILVPVLKYKVAWEQISFFFYLGNVFAHWKGWIWGLWSPTHPALSINLSHFWSLFVEEQFYLMWPVVVYFVGDRIKLIRICIVIIFVAFALRVAFLHFLPFDAAMDASFRQLPSRADDLAMGSCLALLLRGPNAERWLRWTRPLFVIGFAGVILTSVFSHSAGFGSAASLTVGMDFVSIASVGLVSACVQSDTAIHRALSWAPLRRLGLYSYGFYVYHLLFTPSREFFFDWAKAHFHSVAFAGAMTAAIYFMGTLFVAALSYELYEKKFLNLKRYFPYETKASASSLHGGEAGNAVLVTGS